MKAWLQRFNEWLQKMPVPWERPDFGDMVFLGFQEVPMGTRLKGAIAFTALPQGFEKEIVARDLKVFVGEELVASTQLPVAEGPFTFEVEQGSEGRVEYRYVDDAGNVSDDAKVLPFVATDQFAPPTPVDGTLTFEEVPDPVDPVEPV